MSTTQLHHNVLTRLDSALIAVAGTAPANSIAVSTGALVAAVGLFGPGALLLGALVMFGLAIAYYYLNAWRSDAGAGYAWVGRALNPELGFLAGWSILVANTIFMVAGSLPAASATLDLFAPRLSTNVLAVTAVGAVWFLVVNIVVLAGIRTTAYFQRIVTGVEIVGLAALAAIGIVKAVVSGQTHGFTFAWFSPYPPGGFAAVMAGALVALFYFWGWDVTANLAEETVDHSRAPGIGGLRGMLILLILFIAMQISIQLILPMQAIGNAGSSVLDVFANAILPRPWSDISVIIVILSTIATIETSLLVVSRTLMSMSRDRVISEKFGELNPRFQTPWFGSILMGVISLALFAAAASSSSISSILNESVNAIGIYIAFYYGLSALACMRYYRSEFAHDRRALWLKGIWPMGAAVFLWIVVVAQLISAGWRADAVTLGLLALGIVPMLAYKSLYKSAFYTEPLEAH
ncbi:MAG TPA: APC family permease [Candidatus Binatus sp.]|nr:APC family permease [Candidatus Binatus sp.]